MTSVSVDLADTVRVSRACTAIAVKLAGDIDSDRISMDGVVLDPVDDDDSAVQHVKEALRGLGA